MAYKVFISYSTKDINTVNRIKSMLQHSSIEVFVAEYSVNPGEPLPEKIIQAIKNCNLFILLWSSNSKESDWVPQEIGIAKSSDKAMLPVVLEPHLALPGFISNLKYLNAYQEPERSIEWLQINVFKKAEEKTKKDGLVWLGLGAAVLWLSSRS
ncbi:MAG TPA: toll/interleukin-1 receptor domain-containing protein [Nitrospirae bacterium]|mgnify:CR=1 FL=1|nr:toll/interleukin-1 receptor domain-containing protein [Nitrospirota bacterium]